MHYPTTIVIAAALISWCHSSFLFRMDWMWQGMEDGLGQLKATVIWAPKWAPSEKLGPGGYGVGFPPIKQPYIKQRVNSASLYNCCAALSIHQEAKRGFHDTPLP